MFKSYRYKWGLHDSIHGHIGGGDWWRTCDKIRVWSKYSGVNFIFNKRMFSSRQHPWASGEIVWICIQSCIDAGNRCKLPSTIAGKIWPAFHELRLSKKMHKMWEAHSLVLRLSRAQTKLQAMKSWARPRNEARQHMYPQWKYLQWPRRLLMCCYIADNFRQTSKIYDKNEKGGLSSPSTCKHNLHLSVCWIWWVMNCVLRPWSIWIINTLKLHRVWT